MADTQFVDDYVELLRAKGNTSIYAWRTPAGEIYYGDKPREQETGVQRVSQIEDTTIAPDPITAMPTTAPQAPAAVPEGGDKTERDTTGRVDIKSMDAAELSEATKAALMTFSGVNAIGGNPMLEALASATGTTGAAIGKIIADNNMATLNALNIRAQELGVQLDTEGNLIGVSPEQLEEIKTKTAFGRDRAGDATTRAGAKAARLRREESSKVGKRLGIEPEGLFGIEWSREQQDRIRNEVLRAPTQVEAPTPVTDTGPSGRAERVREETERVGRSVTSGGRTAGGTIGSFGLADGGRVERGQTPQDPIAAPMGVNPGTADDLQRKVSEGEFVVPKDVVDSKGEEFFQKLITSTREAKAKMEEEKAAVRAAQQGQGQQIAAPQPAPSSNVQPGTTGMLTLPQGVGAARRPLI